MKQNIGVISLVLILVASAIVATPAFAKNLNTSPATVLYYSGGEATIALPSPLTGFPPGSWPSNKSITAPMMKIAFMRSQIPNSGVKLDSSGILIQFYQTSSANNSLHWEPQAFLTTDSNAVSSLRAFWNGTFIEFPGTYYNKLYNISSFVNTDNVKLVSTSVLQVERHGNDVSISLAAPQNLTRPNGIVFTVPAFTLELKSYGGSVRTTEFVNMTGWAYSSNHTVNIDETGFLANGAFTSSAWGYNGHSVTNALVTMHGIQTNYPPAT